MFASRLHCNECGYKSAEFSESKDLYEDSYDLLFEDTRRREILVRPVKESQLDELGIDLDGLDAASRIQAAFARSNENYIHLPVGDSEDVATNVFCPKCQKGKLTKSVCGVT
jgi:C4-type Zn-finger protein